MLEDSQAILLYAQVNAPSPPNWLVALSSDAWDNGTPTQAAMHNWSDNYTARPLYKDGKTYNNAFNHSVFLNETALDWAKKNITNLAKDIRGTNTLPGYHRSGAHIDRTRNYTLLYLIKDGGDDHSTAFYQEKGAKELIRPREYHVDDYEQLVEIGRTKFKLNTWNLVQARVLHSIENIPNGRFSIQISLDDIPNDLLLIDPVFVNI